ncbi:hypothetical protein N9Y92_01155 [Chlamydiales bacterium]|nr:hypothetical protein [Chlamydiales bacterium]
MGFTVIIKSRTDKELFNQNFKREVDCELIVSIASLLFNRNLHILSQPTEETKIVETVNYSHIVDLLSIAKIYQLTDWQNPKRSEKIDSVYTCLFKIVIRPLQIYCEELNLMNLDFKYESDVLNEKFRRNVDYPTLKKMAEIRAKFFKIRILTIKNPSGETLYRNSFRLTDATDLQKFSVILFHKTGSNYSIDLSDEKDQTPGEEQLKTSSILIMKKITEIYSNCETLL